MTDFILIVAFLVIAVLIIDKVRHKKVEDVQDEEEKNSKKYDPEQDVEIIKANYIQTNLLTPTEYSFYKQLQNVVADYNIDILFKVRLADIFQVKYKNKDYHKYFARIKSKHIDFLLLDKNTVKPVIAIELDDISHNKQSSFKNDNFKNAIFSISSIQLIRIKVQKPYNFCELINALTPYKK